MRAIKKSIQKTFPVLYKKYGQFYRQLTDSRHVRKAVSAVKRQNWEEALAWWEKAYREDPNNIRATLGLISAKRRLKKTEGLEEFIQNFIRKFPDNPLPYRELGKFQFRNDDNKSIEAFTKSFELERSGTVGATLMQLHVNNGAYQQAITVFEKAYPGNKESVRLLVLASLAYLKTGMLEKSNELVIKGVKEHPDDEELYRAIGMNVITMLNMCQGGIGEGGQLLPISLKYRPNFLSNPNKALEEWDTSLFKSVLDRAKLQLQQNNSAQKKIKKKANLLFVTDSNWNFMQGIVEWFYSDADFNVKTLELSDLPKKSRIESYTLSGRLIADNLNGRKTNFELPKESYYRQLMEWADIIFVEWCNYSAVWMSMFVPPEKKLVVRLHSFEAFTPLPHLVNWGNVDVLINVAPHIQKFLTEQINIKQHANTRLRIVANFNQLKIYQLPKKQNARKTLGLIGYNNANKNPLMAAEILSMLREKDDDWRLLLVGHTFPEIPKNEEDKEHKEKFDNFIQESNLHEAICEYGFMDKLEGAITEIGYILSLSEREGTHESIIQSMASGCIPLIVNWPVVSKYGGPKNIFDEKWIINDAREAADKILEIQNTGRYDECCLSAKNEVMEKYDYSVVMPQLKKILIEE